MKINIIKKGLMLLTFSLISMSLLPGEAFAEASNRFRSGCGLSKRYKSKTKVTQPGWFNDESDTDRSCNFARSFSFISGCGSASADAGPGVNSRVTNVIDDDCTAGIAASDIFYDLLFNRTMARTTDYHIKNNLEHNQAFDLENRTFTFINGNGALRIAKDYPGYAKWEIKFGRDLSNGTEENIDFYREEYIIIKNNKVEFSKGLNIGSAYRVTEDEHFYTVELINFSQTFEIPETVDMETELVVEVSSYADADEARIIREELGKSTNNVNVFPNPSNGQFNVEVITAANTSLEIAIYDELGTRIMNSTRYSSNDTTVSITNADFHRDLTPGVYFIMITGEGISEMRKLVVH